MIQTILFVEDDASDSALIRRAFEKAGIADGLIRAKDGDDAVAYLDGSAPYQDRIANPLPCLVLLDIKLPRRSGFEVLSWIRRDPRPLRCCGRDPGRTQPRDDVYLRFRRGHR